jgi:hypothetical protein
METFRWNFSGCYTREIVLKVRRKCSLPRDGQETDVSVHGRRRWKQSHFLNTIFYYCGYLTTLSVVHLSVASTNRASIKFQRTYKKTDVSWREVLSRYLCGGTEENHSARILSLFMTCDCRRGFGFITGFFGLFHTARDFTIIHIHYCLQSHLHCRCSVTASNRGRSPYSGFQKGNQPQLPASHSNSSQLNCCSSLSDLPANSLTS